MSNEGNWGRNEKVNIMYVATMSDVELERIDGGPAPIVLGLVAGFKALAGSKIVQAGVATAVAAVGIGTGIGLANADVKVEVQLSN
jgi:hypothetical protein